MNRYASAIRRLGAAWLLCAIPVAFSQNYVQTNLVSDIAQPANADGSAVTVDPLLKNAWGLSRGASSPWWVNNGGTGTSTLYTGSGRRVNLVVTVPNGKDVPGPSVPTGMIFNGTDDFALAPNNPAVFIFATANGTISGWGPPATPVNPDASSLAINKVDESKSGANFTGLTWVEVEGQRFLLAANFSRNRIEAFDTTFKRVSLADTFDDDRVPSGFAPYNVQAVGAFVVVTYAKQNAKRTAPDDNCGEECGFVSLFTSTGKFLRRLQSGPWLRAPWGVALAPQDFGFFSHDLLIGNRFGGTIAAFNPVNGRFLGNLVDASDAPIAIDGLWALEFDNRGNNEAGTAAHPSTGPALFFSAGIDHYAHGLFGTLTPVDAQLNAEDHE